MKRPSNNSRIKVAHVGLALLLAGLIVSHPLVRALFAAPLLLFGPGFIMTAALFPRHKLDLLSRFLFGVGLSMAAMALGGLLLTQTPWGLQPATWIVYLGAVTVTAALFAFRRRPAGFALAIPAGVGLHFRQIVILGVAGVVIIAAASLARAPASQQGLEGYTVLWLQPAGRTRPNEAHLGITSMEFTKAAYRLQLQVNGQISHEWPAIELDPGQSWEYQLTLSPEQVGKSAVEARLYHPDAAGQLYRHVVWWPGVP